MEDALSNDMALHVEDDSETATEPWKRVPPLDFDDNTCDEKSSPRSPPPPANKNVSFKPFIMSRAQKRALAENASRERLTAITRTSSESEDRETTRVDQIEKRATEEARSNKMPDSTDLKSLIDAAKQKALANNKPKKADRVEELYQRSLNDQRLTVLLETALRTNATPEQQHELQQYIDGTKSTPAGISRDTTPKYVTITEPKTAMKNEEAQTSNVPTKEITTTITQATEPVTSDTLATFCATQLWSRYCHLPPGPNTTVSFKTFTSSTINDRGQSVPKYPAPPLWLEQLTKELSFLLDMARVDRCAWIKELIAQPGYKSQDVHALLAEEVRWATHHAYKRREVRKEIGVLLECAGIERKGSFWYPAKTQ
jgi:hypothetical protein